MLSTKVNNETEPLGNRKKDGVIMKCESGFQYYSGSGDSSLKPIVMLTKAGNNRTVKTIKITESVTVANNLMTVTVHPDGSIDIVPNALS